MIALRSSEGNGTATAERPPARGCTIEYATDAFELGDKLVVGRRIASRGFLKALCRYGSSEQLRCLTASNEEFCQFTQRLAEWSASRKHACWITDSDIGEAPEAACVLRQDPQIAPLAWRRRFLGQRAYSLCGITHTICSGRAIDALADLLIAPVQSWDAIVCTSRAARDVVAGVVREWAEYLKRRTGGAANTPVQLPIIPLGVDCEAYERRRDYKSRRAAWRKEWKIARDEVVVLYVGRLSFHAKANPHPLFVAMRDVVRQTKKKVRLVLAGQFPNAPMQTAFTDACRAVCPDLPITAVPGSPGEPWRDVWWGADVFVSLVDNIQETFGLTPLEAMAAGLPVVVSDWDGYRDTVRDGVDGFRIPTTIPPAGAGEELIRRYFLGMDSYNQYIGYTSALVGVDVPAATAAILRLVQDRRLRRQMGEAAQERARQFDWSDVIRQYEDLWEELAARRRRDQETAPCAAGRPLHPLRQDPFRLFAGYATSQLSDEDELSIGSAIPLDVALKLDILNLAKRLLAAREECLRMLEEVGTERHTVRTLLDRFPSARQDVIRNTIAWMVKGGLLLVAPRGSANGPITAVGITSLDGTRPIAISDVRRLSCGESERDVEPSGVCESDDGMAVPGGQAVKPARATSALRGAREVHHFKTPHVDPAQVKLPLSRRDAERLGLSGLHCGCGANLKSGCLNTDEAAFDDSSGHQSRPGSVALVGGEFHYLQHDATQPFPIQEACFEWIYSEHLIEHIPLAQGVAFLREMRRLLKAGGFIRISTPDLARYMAGYAAAEPGTRGGKGKIGRGGDRFFEEHARRLEAMGIRNVPTRTAWLVNQIFYHWGHRWIYDFQELQFAAATAGFRPEDVTRCRFREGRLGNVAAFDRAVRNDESLYVEIVKRG